MSKTLQRPSPSQGNDDDRQIIIQLHVDASQSTKKALIQELVCYALI